MPTIEIRTELQGGRTEVMLAEHVPSEVLADERYAEQLVERLGWAVVDAEQHEQAREAARAGGPSCHWPQSQEQRDVTAMDHASHNWREILTM